MSDEPKIEEQPAQKNTTLLYKIDPMIPYFPECKAVNKDKLILIKKLYN